MSSLWYYAPHGTERKGPVSENEIRDLIAQGLIGPDDMLWRDGLSAWTPLRRLTEFQAPPAVPESASARVPVPPGLSGWMAFNGIVIILSGVAYALSCFALPSGILLIIAGAALMSAQSMLAGLRQVDSSLLPFLQKLRTFFLLTGIATLVAMVFTLIFLIVGFGLGAAMLTNAMEQFTHP